MKDMQPEYVDELKDYDIDMLEHSLGKNAKDYKAIDLQDALVIMRNLLGSTLKKVGVQISVITSYSIHYTKLYDTVLKASLCSKLESDSKTRTFFSVV